MTYLFYSLTTDLISPPTLRFNFEVREAQHLEELVYITTILAATGDPLPPLPIQFFPHSYSFSPSSLILQPLLFPCFLQPQFSCLFSLFSCVILLSFLGFKLSAPLLKVMQEEALFSLIHYFR